MARQKHVPQYLFTEILGVDVTGIDVVIDTRERSKYQSAFVNRFTELLDHFGYTWIKTKLPAGDILINRGRGICIERKTVGDLIGTAFGQREDGDALASELKKLVDPEIFDGAGVYRCLCCENGMTISIKQEYDKQIVEKTKYGKPVKVTEYKEKRSFSYKNHKGKRRQSKIYPNSWISIVQKVQHFVPYFDFSGVDHFVSWIIAKIRKEIQYEKDKVKGEEDIQQFRMSNKVNKLTLSEQQQYFVEGLPKCGPKIAVRGLECYSTPRLFILNIKKVEDLTNLGMGEPFAEHILNLLDHPFDRNDVSKKKKKKKKKPNYSKKPKRSAQETLPTLPKKEKNSLTEKIRDSELADQYEKENEGKKALWGGNETKGFIKWKEKMEKIKN